MRFRVLLGTDSESREGDTMGTASDAEGLHALMEFGHVVRVHADGIATDAESGAPYADDLWDDEPNGEWSAMRGYSGQHGYRGPTMHASEYVGGGLARDILATPGLYVVVESHVSDADDCDATHRETGCDCSLAGWAVLTIADDDA